MSTLNVEYCNNYPIGTDGSVFFLNKLKKNIYILYKIDCHPRVVLKNVAFENTNISGYVYASLIGE